MSSERRLAAIMFTDIVGYTALMGRDQRLAFALLQKNRELQKPVVEAFNGQWIKEIGDGVLASFDTVSNAVNAGIRIQEECNAADDLQLRIGIHLGEVVFESGDVFGDGVNVASRIEALGIPGSVLISKSVRDQIKNDPHFVLVSLGAFAFKNVSEPVEVFAVANPGCVVPQKEEMRGSPHGVRKRPGIYKWLAGLLIVAVAILAIWYFTGQEQSATTVPDKSIAVLPFVNNSGDPEQEYFSDGLSEELINVLAKTPQLKVIGRTSSFAIKGRNEDLRQIGEMLDVSYLVEGSVRKAGDVLRITVQLINAADGSHLYAQTFDRKLEDVFAIQDEISLDILDAVKINLLEKEKDAVLKRYTENVEAYQLYLKGRFWYNKYTPAAMIKAIEFLEEAIEIEPDYAIAYAGISYCYLTLWYYGWMPPEQSLPLGLQAAEKSLELDDEIAESHLAMGRVKLHYEFKIREAEEEYQKAVAINPNHPECYIQLSFCAVHSGNNAEALKYARISDELDPFSLMNLYMLTATIWATGDMVKTMENGRRLIDMEPNFFGGYFWVGVAYSRMGNNEEAIPALKQAVKLNHSPFALYTLGRTYGLMGEGSKAKEVIAEMKSFEGVDIAGNGYIGVVYASMGELDTAFQYFDRAIENHEGWMLWATHTLRVMPEFMQDPRARELFERLGVPLE